MDVVDAVIYCILSMVFIVLSVFVGYLSYDYYTYKSDLDTRLTSTFAINKARDDSLVDKMKDNRTSIINTENMLFNNSSNLNIYTSNYIGNTSNSLINYSSNLNFNTSNSLINYSSNLNFNTSNSLNNYSSNLNFNTSNFYNNKITNLHDNLDRYFQFGTNNSANKITNKWDNVPVSTIDYDKISLIKSTSITSGLTINTDNNNKSLNVCDLSGGNNCYKIDYTNNILKIKNKNSVASPTKVEIGSLLIDTSLDNTISINNTDDTKDIKIGKLSINKNSLMWDGKPLNMVTPAPLPPVPLPPAPLPPAPLPPVQLPPAPLPLP